MFHTMSSQAFVSFQKSFRAVLFMNPLQPCFPLTDHQYLAGFSFAPQVSIVSCPPGVSLWQRRENSPDFPCSPKVLSGTGVHIFGASRWLSLVPPPFIPFEIAYHCFFPSDSGLKRVLCPLHLISINENLTKLRIFHLCHAPKQWVIL